MRLTKSFGFAINGLKHCLREPNFKIHIGFAALAIVLGLSFSISLTEWIVVIVCIGLVLASEMFNTAIEHLCNVVYPGFNPSIKIVKDVSAAAVLLIAIMAATCGVIIFLPKIFVSLQNL